MSYKSLSYIELRSCQPTKDPKDFEGALLTRVFPKRIKGSLASDLPFMRFCYVLGLIQGMLVRVKSLLALYLRGLTTGVSCKVL